MFKWKLDFISNVCLISAILGCRKGRLDPGRTVRLAAVPLGVLDLLLQLAEAEAAEPLGRRGPGVGEGEPLELGEGVLAHLSCRCKYYRVIFSAQTGNDNLQPDFLVLSNFLIVSKCKGDIREVAEYIPTHHIPWQSWLQWRQPGLPGTQCWSPAPSAHSLAQETPSGAAQGGLQIWDN